MRLADGHVIHRHLDQVVPDLSGGTRPNRDGGKLDGDDTTAEDTAAAAVPLLVRPVSPSVAAAADRAGAATVPASVPVAGGRGAPEPAATLPAELTTSSPDRPLSDSVSEELVTAASSPGREEMPQPRYNLRPRKRTTN